MRSSSVGAAYRCGSYGAKTFCWPGATKMSRLRRCTTRVSRKSPPFTPFDRPYVHERSCSLREPLKPLNGKEKYETISKLRLPLGANTSGRRITLDLRVRVPANDSR